MQRYKFIYLATLLLLSLAITPLTLLADADKSNAKNETQNVVIHLSKYTNDLHASFMAFKLATELKKAGANVTVFLDLEGVRSADKRQPQDLTWGMGNSGDFAAIYQSFINAGGEVLVCPHCAKSVGMSEKDLRAGAKLATVQKITKLILSADKIMDY